MPNPNKMFKSPLTESIHGKPAYGRLDIALEGDEGNFYLDIEMCGDGRIKLIDPDTGAVILRYNNMAELENFINKSGFGHRNEGEYLERGGLDD